VLLEGVHVVVELEDVESLDDLADLALWRLVPDLLDDALLVAVRRACPLVEGVETHDQPAGREGADPSRARVHVHDVRSLSRLECGLDLAVLERERPWSELERDVGMGLLE